jgi:Na+(H+)/acetate symporter ActP
MDNDFEGNTGIRPACRKDLADTINCKLERIVVAVPNLAEGRSATTWAQIVAALLCLITRITASFFAFWRLEINDSFGIALPCSHSLYAVIVEQAPSLGIATVLSNCRNSLP